MNIEKYIEELSEEMARKGYRSNSTETYIPCVKKFLYHFKNKASKPTEINERDIKKYLGLFTDHNTQRSHHSAIKCFYKYVIKQPNKFRYIEYCKRNRRLPIVLSVEEVSKIIFCASNIKHKAIICLMYSTGMRISEVINLKIGDIDKERNIINIIDAKGGEDRQVPLDPILLILLREYYKQYRTEKYLFEGPNKSSQYSESSIRQFLQKYSDDAGIKKRVYPHLIRHCHATHLLEAGTELSIIQKILGHKNIKTTQIYSHISHNLLSNTKTPLSFIIDKSNNQKLLQK